MLLVDSILLLSPFVQTSLLAEEKVIPQASKMCGKTGRVKGEEDRKVLEDLPTLVAAAERRKVEDAHKRVIFHRVLKSVSSVVRLIIGRVTVQ